LKASSKWVESLKDLSSNEELQRFGGEIKAAGFSGFYEIQDYIRDTFKRYDESSMNDFILFINQVKIAVPNPGEISPSWTKFWLEIDRMIEIKNGLFSQVTIDNRDGEWQVIIDNPFSHDNVACYPMLSFLEGTYLYAYFYLNLKKNEYVRLQKITNVVMTHGE
jgi:hypothetical protein